MRPKREYFRRTPTSPNPDLSSAFHLLRSTGNHGASWNFPARPIFENNDVAGTGAVFEDKQLMTVDNTVGSPFQDRVYVTWTEFAADGTACIWSAHSGDYTGLSAVDTAFPAWSDTRNPALFLCPGTGVPGVPPAVCQRSAINAAVANDQEI